MNPSQKVEQLLKLTNLEPAFERCSADRRDASFSVPALTQAESLEANQVTMYAHLFGQTTNHESSASA